MRKYKRYQVYSKYHGEIMKGLIINDFSAREAKTKADGIYKGKVWVTEEKK